MCTTIIKSNFIDSKDSQQLNIKGNHYMVVAHGCIEGVFKKIPPKYNHMPIIDYSQHMIMPSFVDVHVHAPQYNNLGLGMDMELLQWLETYTFPEEKKFNQKDYREQTYKKFINKLWQNGTLACVAFATIHKDSALDLARLIEKSHLRGFVGKVNMDQNSPTDYCEDTSESYKETVSFISEAQSFTRVKPIITPRFAPSCTSKLLYQLGQLAAKQNLLVQSHLSENRSEIEWVEQLFPNSKNYTRVYLDHGLLRSDYKTIMAHCVWLSEDERQLLKEKRVLIAHAPYSNGNLTSGIAPIKTYLKQEIPVALCSDASGGHVIFMGRIIQLAAILSNMYWVHVDKTDGKLSFEELFYMATRAGGKLFGDLAAFKKGFKADFLVIDDSSLADNNTRALKERIQRFIYCGDERNIKHRYIDGVIVEKPFKEV